MSHKKPTVATLNLVDYDRTIKYELKHPATGDGLGVIFDLASQGSEAIKDVVRKQFAEISPSQKITDEARISKAEKLSEERIAACIVGLYVPEDQEFMPGIIGAPELTMENKLIIVRVAWVFEQLNEQANKIQNFINP